MKNCIANYLFITNGIVNNIRVTCLVSHIIYYCGFMVDALKHTSGLNDFYNLKILHYSVFLNVFLKLMILSDKYSNCLIFVNS